MTSAIAYLHRGSHILDGFEGSSASASVRRANVAGFLNSTHGFEYRSPFIFIATRCQLTHETIPSQMKHDVYQRFKKTRRPNERGVLQVTSYRKAV